MTSGLAIWAMPAAESDCELASAALAKAEARAAASFTSAVYKSAVVRSCASLQAYVAAVRTATGAKRPVSTIGAAAAGLELTYRLLQLAGKPANARTSQYTAGVAFGGGGGESAVLARDCRLPTHPDPSSWNGELLPCDIVRSGRIPAGYTADVTDPEGAPAAAIGAGGNIELVFDDRLVALATGAGWIDLAEVHLAISLRRTATPPYNSIGDGGMVLFGCYMLWLWMVGQTPQTGAAEWAEAAASLWHENAAAPDHASCRAAVAELAGYCHRTVNAAGRLILAIGAPAEAAPWSKQGHGQILLQASEASLVKKGPPATTVYTGAPAIAVALASLLPVGVTYRIDYTIAGIKHTGAWKTQ